MSIPQALGIRRAALGEQHPDVGQTYNNMAVVYENQGKYEQALELYSKAPPVRHEGQCRGEGVEDL